MYIYIERALCSSLCCSILVKSNEFCVQAFAARLLKSQSTCISVSGVIFVFICAIGNFLSDFNKVVLILILWLSSLPRDLIAERAFPMFNENELITLTLKPSEGS